MKSERIPVTDYIVKQCDIIDASCLGLEIEKAYFQLWRDCRFNNKKAGCGPIIQADPCWTFGVDTQRCVNIAR